MAANKNSTRGSRIGGNRGPAISPEVSFIQPLAQGRFARVTDPATNKNPHMSTDGDAFVEAVRKITDAGLGERARAELVSLHERFPGHAWDARLRRLDEAGVFAVQDA